MLINPLPYAADLQEPLSDKPVKDMSPNKQCRALVDADMFVYAAGFAVEHHEPIAYDERGNLLGQWKGKSKYNDWCKKFPKKAALVHELDYYDWMEDFKQCEFILRNKKKSIIRHTDRAKQTWFLTKGSTLWRNVDAKLQPYKGNREKMEKPFYYDDCRTFMEDKFGAKVCKGLEADDSVGQTGRDNVGHVIICSGDKDLDTIVGKHLNIGKMKNGVYYVTPLQACRNIYIQMLMGDKIDNIKGLSGSREEGAGYGIKTATDAISQFYSEYDMAQFVAAQYQKKYPDGAVGWNGDYLTWQDILCETANLLFLRRYNDTKFVWED